jgi:predicted Ser/Thr protein kinase
MGKAPISCDPPTVPMQCPTCHAQVDSGKFCAVCGAALPGAAASPGGASSPDAPSESLVGQTLGAKYKIVALLGEGGMGCVYKGEQQLGTKTRNVAIKTLHPHLSKDPKILARFEREVGTIAELEHPNTIQVYDFGKTEGGILYIVMEFVQGQNLADTLEKGGAMEPARVEKIMNQICGSLEEAHGRGIIHRDLKPDNIVLTERAGSKDFVKVLDFGIAKRSNEEDKNEQKLTQQGMVLGTPPYMSPEQFTGKPIDARSDIYSLAIMAYEMLTGNMPFAANTAWEWATQHMTAPPKDIDQMPFHERIPPRMKDALRRALQKSPDDRFPNVRQFFDAFSGGAPANATPVAPGQPAIGAAPAAAQAKGKTEIGTPLDFGGAAPPAPSGGGYGSNPGPVVVQAGTPALGNVAYPTPNAGVPQAPPNARQAGKADGGNRGMLLGIAAVVGVLSVGMIAFALKGSSSSGGSPPPLMPPSTAPAATVDLTEAGATPTLGNVPTIDTSSQLGKLIEPGIGGGPITPHPARHDAGVKEPGGKEPGGKEPGGAPKPGSSGPGTVPIKPPPAAENFACTQAAVMRKAGNMGAFQQLKKACEAAGGTVPP